MDSKFPKSVYYCIIHLAKGEPRYSSKDSDRGVATLHAVLSLHLSHLACV